MLTVKPIKGPISGRRQDHESTAPVSGRQVIPGPLPSVNLVFMANSHGAVYLLFF